MAFDNQITVWIIYQDRLFNNNTMYIVLDQTRYPDSDLLSAHSSASGRTGVSLLYNNAIKTGMR